MRALTYTYAETIEATYYVRATLSGAVLRIYGYKPQDIRTLVGHLPGTDLHLQLRSDGQVQPVSPCCRVPYCFVSDEEETYATWEIHLLYPQLPAGSFVCRACRRPCPESLSMAVILDIVSAETGELEPFLEAAADLDPLSASLLASQIAEELTDYRDFIGYRQARFDPNDPRRAYDLMEAMAYWADDVQPLRREVRPEKLSRLCPCCGGKRSHRLFAAR